MISINYVDSVREEFSYLLKNRLFQKDKSGSLVLEIRASTFIADHDTIFGTVDQDYVKREHEWYMSQSLNVNNFPGGAPTIWKQVANAYGEINSNYGYRIFSEENGSQYKNVVRELKKNPDSRRAVMIYTEPSMWHLYDFDGMSDFVCTNAVEYLIRYGKLEAIVQMRSSDAVYGYKGDLAWQTFVLNEVAKEVGVIPGRIHWHAGSLHVYQRHFYLVDHYLKTGDHSIKRKQYDELYPDGEWRQVATKVHEPSTTDRIVE